MKKIDLNEMKKLQIEMLKYIDSICEENGIEYFLLGGSLIGAVRHNGFIPWDDDIDIGLTYENYKKLCKVLSKNNNHRYQLMNHENNSEYYYPFSKLINTDTMMNEDNFKEINNYGVYIDIFAYFQIPDNEKLRIKQYKKLKNMQRQIFYNCTLNPYNSNWIKNVLKTPLVVYSKLKGTDRILNDYNKILLKYNNEKSNYVISNWPLYKMNAEIQKISSVKGTMKHKFEDMQASIPNNYDEFLKTTFGDYMQLPPKEKRVVKHLNEAYWRK